MMISRRTLCAAAAAAPFAAWPFASAYAAGSGIELMQAQVQKRSDGVYLSASWEFDLAITLIESLRRGIALYFVCEARLQKKRWYWLDKDLAEAELVQRISFSPLARNYRLSFGGLSRTFDSLEQVLPLVRQIHDWRIADVSAVEDADDIEAEVRMRLDASRLPKPLQVTIGGNSDWDLDSDWISVRITRSAA